MANHTVSSNEALIFDAVPKHLGIVGGGYIGLELGAVWLRLGAKVTVIEMLPIIAPTLDGQVGRKLQRVLKRQGINFQMQSRVTKAKISGKNVRVELETKKGPAAINLRSASGFRRPPSPYAKFGIGRSRR